MTEHLYLREGNPLVYGGAVSRVEGDPAAGEVVDVIDSSGKFIAWGTKTFRFVVLAHVCTSRPGLEGGSSRILVQVVVYGAFTAVYRD